MMNLARLNHHLFNVCEIQMIYYWEFKHEKPDSSFIIHHSSFIIE